MIPIRDENPARRTPFVTWVIIAACVGVFFILQQGVAEGGFLYRWATVPCEVITQEPLAPVEVATGNCIDGNERAAVFPDKSVLVSLLMSLFLHGSILHLAGNMLFLWVFGNNIEDTWGHVAYAVFYVVAGIVATAAHIATDINSVIPVVGASGSIAGVMGAYLVLFPRAPIRTVFIFILILIRDVPAWLLLGLWFFSQFLIGTDEGVAWAAHVGGFVFGVVVGLVWRLRHPPRPRALAYGA